MKKYLVYILAGLLIPGIVLAYKPATLFKGLSRVAVYSQEQASNLFAQNYKLEQSKQLGISISVGYTSKLSSSITSSATTIYVANVKDINGYTLPCSASDPCYFNLEPGSTRQEPILCTGIGTLSFTGCTRGLAATGIGTTGSSTLSFAHNAGSSIIMTNIGQFYGNFVDMNGNQTIAGIKTFSSFPITPSSLPTIDYQVANKHYVDIIGSSGFTVANASTTLGMQTNLDVTSVGVPAVGSTTGGGIVYDTSGGTAYIVATTDISGAAIWGCSGTLIGSGAQSMSDGKSNTVAILAGCSTAGIAARLCASSTVGGYTDWYLPSAYQITTIYNERVMIGGLGATTYVSSTEFDNNYMYYYHFNDGNLRHDDLKSDTNGVRCVREYIAGQQVVTLGINASSTTGMGFDSSGKLYQKISTDLTTSASGIAIAAAQLTPVGSITAYATSTAPSGWLLCDGSTVSSTTYAALFAIIGYTYGGSLGNNFVLPDLRGRTIIMASSTLNNKIGATAGQASTTLDITQMPAHTHNLTFHESSGSATGPNRGSPGTAGSYNYTTSSAGGELPFSNMQPYIVLNYIIKY